MGKVAVLLKITPEPDYEINKLEKAIREEVEIKDMKKKNIGFGLSILKILVTIPDSKGGTEEIENKISELEGVKRVEVEDITVI